MDPKPAQEAQPTVQQATVETPEKPVTQHVETDVSVQPTPMPKSGNAMGKVFFIFIALLLFIIVAGVSYYLGTQQGKSQQLQEVLQKTKENLAKEAKLTQISTATPTPDSASIATAATTNWQTYTNMRYAFSVKYDGLAVKEVPVDTNYFYVEFININSGSSLPLFVIAIIPDTFVANNIAAYNYMSSDFINTLIALNTGDSKTDGGTTFTKLPDTVVAGSPASVVEVTTTGPKQRRVYIKKNGYVYMLSNNFQTTDELANFNLFLSSFKFTQ